MNLRVTAVEESAGSLPATDRVGVADVTRELRARIASQAIPPGARLREWEVATEFEIPRLSAREALERLVHLGFVDRQPNRGIVVRRRELAEILRLFDLREVNEGLCTRLAATNVSPESWRDLAELFGAPMAAIVERKDLHAYVENYELLRYRLIDAAGSPPLADLLQWLYDMTDIFVRRVLLVSDRAYHGLRDHRAVLAALHCGDAQAAERLRRGTVVNIRAAVERYGSFVL